MVQAPSPCLSLEQFLAQPETKPACEYINGSIIQKPLPKGRHSRLQSKLCSTINQVAETAKVAYAFPELRCSFGERSIVPDVAVFQWTRIPFTPTGEVPDHFAQPPDWTIEILSPEQRSNKVIGNILCCIEQGSTLGWLIDPDDLSILTFQPNQQPILYQGKQSLPILSGVALALTANQIFELAQNGLTQT